MKPEKERDVLDRALRRLGSVAPDVLASARERIRRNLKVGHWPTTPLPPLPDATPASLGPLRRPFRIAAAAAVCALLAIGAMVQWNRSTQSAPKTPVEIASTHPSAPVEMARFALLPPGDGKVILDRACGGCHRAAAVGRYHFATKAEYAALVARMIAMGAPVSANEADELVDYLFDNMRIKAMPPGSSHGRAILERACTTCHSLNGIEKYVWSSEGPYRELVSSMISYGAVLSDDEKTALVQYLFTTYGKR